MFLPRGMNLGRPPCCCNPFARAITVDARKVELMLSMDAIGTNLGIGLARPFKVRNM